MAPYRQTPPARARARRSDHDVVVVGARVAGAATAMLLARAGYDVALVDRSRPSRDTSSTHAIARGGVVQLDRWGLLDRVVATGAPEIRTVSFHHGGGVERRALKDRAGVDFLVAPRRYILDDLIARAAVDAGARLVTDTTVSGLLRDGSGRVVGVEAHDQDGIRRELTGRLVVGADGIRSLVARQVEAPLVQRHAPTGSCFYTYVSGVPWDGFELYVEDGAFAGVFPTHHGEACVWLIRPIEAYEPVITAGASRLSAWLQMLQGVVPDLARRIRPGTVTAPLRGYVALPNHVRRAAGPGWALVGDAGYHRDPVTGHGITDAFRDAELLADAAEAVLSGACTEDAAMTGYELERDAALERTFGLTREIGAFPPAPQFLDLQVRLSRALDEEAQALAARPRRLVLA